MRRMTYFMMALALVLGFTQCKKEQTPANNQTEGVFITLNVENGSKHNVVPGGSVAEVNFESGDVIYVGDGTTYIGTLTCDGAKFSGVVSLPVSDKLYFYFVGGLQTTPADLSGQTSFTVDISDQSSKLPVLSFNSATYKGSGDYKCTLENQCALVKFTLANPAGSIQVGNMHTGATISFATPGITPTGTTGPVRLYSESNTVKWAILLPQAAVSDASVSIGGQSGLKVDVPEIKVNDYITNIPTIDNLAAVLNLTDVTNDTQDKDRTAKDGWVITGTLGVNQKIMIAAGATVTLSDASINANGTWTTGGYAGLSCLGNATIILKDGTTNTVKGFNSSYPGVFVPEGKTLTIQGETKGTGTLIASGNAGVGGGGAGIGGGWPIGCGNITISGGTVTATGGANAAGIGSGTYGSTCGAITISGGTVTATGGASAAGIGSGNSGASCGAITITTGVTRVTATKGDGAPYSIGHGPSSSCGTVTIGGTVYPYGINDSPYIYPMP